MTSNKMIALTGLRKDWDAVANALGWRIENHLYYNIIGQNSGNNLL